ncbi:MAG TPA: helix-turn-helix transcriptional regulator [Stellaceae bacterium]|nr:helix-turn-helix transcriptional regulator [Stellaceae bacterium]
MTTAELMTTDEVAEYLRLKPRRIYELVRTGEIPCARITGKLLFPRQAIELWVSQRTEFAGMEARRAPPVVAGSHDPLLEWALRESGCGLALLSGGSLDGLRRLAGWQAVLAGIHIVDPGGDDNIAALKHYAELAGVVLIEWGLREQGLILARGNPLGIRALGDLAVGGARVARRQEAAGAHLLLLHLLDRASIAVDRLGFVDPPALTETDLAAAVLDGKADCGLAVRAVARRFGLDFIPLHIERFDLALRRFDYFEPPVQALLGFARSAAFARQAAELGGYDITGLGRVRYNG